MDELGIKNRLVKDINELRKEGLAPNQSHRVMVEQIKRKLR